MAITINIYYTGLNGGAKKFLQRRCLPMELWMKFVQKMAIYNMSISSQWKALKQSF